MKNTDYQLLTDVNLKPYHTLGLNLNAKYLIAYQHVEQLHQIYNDPKWENIPKLIIGEGSNIFFKDNYNGLILVNRIKGITEYESDAYYHLEVNGGENWAQLVEKLTHAKKYGLENLALIPGCVGSAPIQNIGAYGMEFKDVCEYVEYLDLTDMCVKRLDNSECEFGYRSSIFKTGLKDKVIILSVGIKLLKNWEANANYAPLNTLESPTALQIFTKVCETRREKIPDPKLIGNVGSFYQNPIIEEAQLTQLLKIHTDMPYYPQKRGAAKIPAGWLIDRCGLKGERIGDAKVHEKQALVLTNVGEAKPLDLIQLSERIQSEVEQKFGIKIKPEVNWV